MKLYEVTNGYIGESYVRCLVVAANEERALELAAKRYKEGGEGHPKNYWEMLKVKCLSEDCTVEYVSEVFD
jgi:hypothetical protein